jgi:hypothetical protein
LEAVQTPFNIQQLTIQAINHKTSKTIKKPTVTPLTTKGKGHLTLFNQRKDLERPWNTKLFPSESDTIQQLAEDYKNMNRSLFTSLQQATITGTHILNKTVPSSFKQRTIDFLNGLTTVPSPCMEEYQEDIATVATITSALMLKVINKHHTAIATALP